MEQGNEGNDPKANSDKSVLCSVCGAMATSVSLFCAKCGSRRLNSLSPAAGSRKSSASSMPPDVQQRLNLLSSGSKRDFSTLLQRSNSSKVSPPAVKLSSAPAPSASFSPVSFEQLANSINDMRHEISTLKDQLLEETRARYRVESLLSRVVEDLMRLKGINLTDDTLEQKLHVATDFLQNMAPQWKVDFDDVDFGDLVAQGGFSDVYDGSYRGARVAIKKLRVDVLDPDEYFLDLEKEVQLLSELNHPNILRFVGVCVWPSYYILTEFMEGGNWDRALLNTNEQLPWALRLHVLLQIASAVHYLHYLQPTIVHLDIKPLNILLGVKNELSWEARLSDFGLSVKKSSIIRTTVAEKRLRNFKAMSQVTQSGSIPTFLPAKSTPMGTPLHIAPEITEKLPFNEKADIYSFGMLIWETITRRSLRSLAPNSNLCTIVTPPIADNVPQALRDLMIQCWKHNGWERPGISAIVRTLGDLPVGDVDWISK